MNNILDLEKLQTDGSFPLEKERFDLCQQIEYAVSMLKAQAAKKDIDLQYKFKESSVIIEADRQQISRVLQNLLSNAIKYTPRGGNVCIESFLENGNVVVSVQDNGYGIPEDELPYVFERFRRVSKHRGIAAGTGLGLAITKALIEAHGGQISVASKEGEGSMFSFRLPLEPQPENKGSL
ncbi:MAG: sensor histidine kinase [Chloroflexi bacterium]|nr:MAG: sensor histidine kinase [Chloroflexota bacterium]